MLYIQQSLNPNEEIIRVGHFHWWYTFNAVLWVVIGFLFMVALFYGGIYYEVFLTIKARYPEVTTFNFFDKNINFSNVVAYRGGWISLIQSMHWGVKLAGFLSFMMGVLLFAQKMVIKAATEICLTTDRLVLKRGLVSRRVEEINIDRIEGVDVVQGILGRMLDFGYVSVRGMGVGEVALPQIEKPVNFRRAIERARSLKKGEKI